MLGVESKWTQREKGVSSKCPGCIIAPISELEEVSDYIYSDVGFLSTRTRAPVSYFFGSPLRCQKVPAQNSSGISGISQIGEGGATMDFLLTILAWKGSINT